MQIELHRLAQKEFDKASNYFYRDDPFKYERFRNAVRATLQRILENPALGSPCYSGQRWMKATPFRYIVYYEQLRDDFVWVYAVAHASRRPRYWLRRTRRD